MSVYIFSNRINGKLGYDNSLISTANHLSNFYDTKIITYGQNLYENNYSQNTKFELKKEIEVITLKNIYIEGSDYSIDKYKVVNTYSDKHYKIEQTEFDVKALEFLSSKLKSDDFVIISNEYASLYLKISGVRFPCRTMMQVHFDLEQTALSEKTLSDVLNFPTFVQPVSSEMITRLMSVSKRNQEDFIHISNYTNDIELNGFKNIGETIRFGVVGSLTERKGQFEAIQAISKLKNCELLIFGESGADLASKEYVKRMHEYVKKNKLENKVKFMGFATQEDMFNIIDISLIPSTIEGFPYSGLEALKYAKPIITYKYNYGSSELVANNNGFLIDSKYRKLRSKMKWFIKNRESFKTYSDNSLKLYHEKYSENTVNKKFRDVIGASSKNEQIQNITRTVAKKYDFEILKLDKESIEFKLNENFENMYVTYKGESIKLEPTNDIFEFKFSGSTTSFYSIEKNGIKTYLFNLNNEASIAIHSFYSNNTIPQEDNKIYEIGSNSALKNYTTDRVISILDRNNNKIPYTVNYLLVDGMYQNVILIEDKIDYCNVEYSKFTVLYKK